MGRCYGTWVRGWDGMEGRAYQRKLSSDEVERESGVGDLESIGWMILVFFFR